MRITYIQIILLWTIKSFFFYVDWKYPKETCGPNLRVFVSGAFIFQPILIGFFFLYAPFTILFIIFFLYAPYTIRFLFQQIFHDY
jgi:hypothetical protein